MDFPEDLGQRIAIHQGDWGVSEILWRSGAFSGE